MNKLLKIKCPQCDKVFSYYDSEFRPFCCERCKMIDLGHWFEENYRVPTKDLEPNSHGQNNEIKQDEDSNEEQSQNQEYEDDENNY